MLFWRDKIGLVVTSTAAFFENLMHHPKISPLVSVINRILIVSDSLGLDCLGFDFFELLLDHFLVFNHYRLAE